MSSWLDKYPYSRLPKPSIDSVLDLEKFLTTTQFTTEALQLLQFRDDVMKHRKQLLAIVSAWLVSDQTALEDAIERVREDMNSWNKMVKNP